MFMRQPYYLSSPGWLLSRGVYGGKMTPKHLISKNEQTNFSRHPHFRKYEFCFCFAEVGVTVTQMKENILVLIRFWIVTNNKDGRITWSSIYSFIHNTFLPYRVRMLLLPFRWCSIKITVTPNPIPRSRDTML